MITQLIDGREFEKIQGIRIFKKKSRKQPKRVGVNDFTKPELIDMARVYYNAMQAFTIAMREITDGFSILKEAIQEEGKTNKKK